MSFPVANICSVRRFDCEGLCQVQNLQNKSFVPDKNLRSWNVVRCSYSLRESSSTQLSYKKIYIVPFFSDNWFKLAIVC